MVALVNFFGLANPRRFMKFTDYALPASTILAIVLTVCGLYWGLVLAPEDYQQGDTVRIMFVHVPSAWMAMACYAVIALASLSSLIWRHPLADMAARQTAPIGALFTALALITGSLWGAPMWGTWWVWDARLTSVLVLLFLYIGYMALWAAMDDPLRAGRAAAVLALVGAVNLPIIKFSVDWWNTLHQPASVARFDGPTIHESILIPLLIMAAAFKAYYAMVLMVRMRAEILERRMLVARSQHITGRG